MTTFGGDTITPGDEPRLSRQLDYVYMIMHDGQWRTIWEIVRLLRVKYGVNVMQTSVSARLRDLRKSKFGGHSVDRLNAGDGRHKYRLIVRKAA